MRPGPVELRRVDGRQLNDRHCYARALGEKFGAQAVGETADGVLRAAIGGLQRNAAIGERRAHLDDPSAPTRLHRLQRRHRAVDETEIGHVGHPAELLRRHIRHTRKHRLHGVVDPDIHRPELFLEPPGGRKHLICVGDVGRFPSDVRAEGRQFAPDIFERRRVAGDEADPVARAGEAPRDGAADACGGACDDNGAGCCHVSLGTLACGAVR